MIFLVPSVHHTGTKLVCNDILRDYEGFNQHEWDRCKTGKIRIHIDEPFLVDIDRWLDRSVSIAPMRHPKLVAQGWKNRVKPLELLEKQWGWLKEFDDRIDYYIPVDSDDRDDWLDEVNLDLELNLTTDWPILGHHEGAEIPLTAEDECLVQAWMDDGFFEQFGYKL